MNKILCSILIMFFCCGCAFSQTADIEYKTSINFKKSESFGSGDLILSGIISDGGKYEYGTNKNQVDTIHTQSGDLASSSIIEIDLQSVVLFSGSIASFSNVKTIFCRNTSTSNDCFLGGDAIGTHTLDAGGVFFLNSPDNGISISSLTNKLYFSCTSTGSYEILISGLKN